MPRRELVSAERRNPTQNEFRSFGRGKSVPFETLPCDGHLLSARPSCLATY
jgi:hypothetical protein